MREEIQTEGKLTSLGRNLQPKKNSLTLLMFGRAVKGNMTQGEAHEQLKPWVGMGRKKRMGIATIENQSGVYYIKS